MPVKPFDVLILSSLVGWLCCGVAGAGGGEVTSEAQRSCLLEHVKSARSALAAQHLQQACARRFPPESRSPSLEIGPEREDELHAYDQCLFRHLSGVQNDASAQAMEQFCHDQFHPGESAVNRPVRTDGLLELLNRIDRPSKSRESQPASAPVIDGETFVPLAPAKAGR
ncbi:MAG: hypothetical protein HQL98_06330 [Magnetococcales bacterium]|nr:hypothetical protein [Magnetococcales bacterium]